MPRFGRRSGTALVGLAVIAVGAAVWFDGRALRSIPERNGLPTSTKMVGRSALSHGGLPPEPIPAPHGQSPIRFAVGQRVIIDQAVAAAVVPHSIRPAAPHALPPGTEVVITSVADREDGRSERSYEVSSSDGRIGWVPERALRVRQTQGGAP
ncbi:MAG: hypothetical protein ACREJU_15990 [Nitrospiraceae bacterium]